MDTVSKENTIKFPFNSSLCLLRLLYLNILAGQTLNTVCYLSTIFLMVNTVWDFLLLKYKGGHLAMETLSRKANFIRKLVFLM